MPETMTKSVDSKGRVVLGPRFANQHVLIREVDDTEVVVTLAAVIPAREAWLHKNPKAKAAIQRGIEKAKRREFSKKPPDLAADARRSKRMGG